MIEIELIWLLLGLPAAFALGWVASRIDLRQLRTANRSAPKAYFKGLTHLLNGQQDQAVDAFMEAVRKDPDTSELHFALGNLFRHRGEYERAVRAHEHLLARADLSADEHDRARYALAQDFLKAGLLDRAEAALLQLATSPSYADQAHTALLGIYERARDWPQADSTATALQERTGHDYSRQRSHYLCERANTAMQQAQPEQARALLQQARQCDPSAARPRLQLADLEQSCGQPQAAFALLCEAVRDLPAFAPLIAAPLAALGQATGQEQTAHDLLHQLQQQHPSIDIVQALVVLEQHCATQPCARPSSHQSAATSATSADALHATTPPHTSPTPHGITEQSAQHHVHNAQTPDAATASADINNPAQPNQHYLAHLQHYPSLLAASRWLQQQAWVLPDEQRQALDRALLHNCKPLARYRCAACGFEASRHYWHCPGCQNWDSYPPRRVEEL